MIALIQKQMPQQSKFISDDSNCVKSEALNLDEDDDGGSEVDKTKLLSGDNDSKCEQAASSITHTSHNARPAAGTLVVCPASVLRQWARELEEKVPKSAELSILIYHGGSRTKCPGDLTRYNVVLTTYSIVTNEVPKQRIADDDEGEQKNLDKYGLSSEFSSNKKRKQPSSGQNKVKKRGKRSKDSHLDVDSGPLARVSGYRKLQAVLKAVLLRRTKEKGRRRLDLSPRAGENRERGRRRLVGDPGEGGGGTQARTASSILSSSPLLSSFPLLLLLPFFSLNRPLTIDFGGTAR
ncbi:hypothetical protein GW17_00033004 [Ensete ventricosum]|nr:hypothetical protein GW17_00033004 [Ensete ventricosum]